MMMNLLREGDFLGQHYSVDTKAQSASSFLSLGFWLPDYNALMSVKLIPCYLLIPGYYQYCWERIKKVALSRQPIVMLFGECKCLDSIVMPNCENVTQFETRFLAPEAPGTYTIMVSYIFS